MSSLLKQSDISKRKLTLARLSSVSIPFTVLSVTANSVNEDFLSVCGLKVLNIHHVEHYIFLNNFYLYNIFIMYIYIHLYNII